MEFSYQNVRRLAEMLQPTEEDSGSEDDLPQSGLSKLGNIINYTTSSLFIVNLIIRVY
jgi:hypothetical protein